MRWPIRLQLLLPNLAVVTLGIVLVSVAFAYRAGREAAAQQEARLNHVVATIADATFPLSEPVLRQMSGLSGAEFLLFDAERRLRSATIEIDRAELRRISELTDDPAPPTMSAGSPVQFGDVDYLSRHVTMAKRSLGNGPLELVVLYPEARWARASRQAMYPPLLIGATMAVVATVVSTMLSRRLVRPIERLRLQAAAIAAGGFRATELPRRNDEIRDLTESINDMAARLREYEEEVRRSERLKTLGQLGAGIAHNLRNSATGARLAVDLHQRSCPLGEDDESLRVVREQLRLMESYLQRFLRLGHTDDAPTGPIDLEIVVDEAVELVRPRCRHAGIELVCHPPADRVTIDGSADSIRQLVVNLLMNAADAVEQRGDDPRRIEVVVAVDGAGNAVLEVGDTGAGLSTHMAERSFEPFATDKPDGSGLGLAVAKEVAESHHGRIAWSRRDRMTWFTVHLPTLAEEASRGTPACRR